MRSNPNRRWEMRALHYTEIEPQEVYGIPGVKVRWLAGRKEGAPNFAFRIFEMEPGSVIPSHEHDWEHEVFVLKGEGIVGVNEEEKTIKEGDFVLIPPGARHKFINIGEGVFRFICVIPLKGDTRP